VQPESQVFREDLGKSKSRKNVMGQVAGRNRRGARVARRILSFVSHGSRCRPSAAGLFVLCAITTLDSMRAQENLPFQLPPPPILALADVDLPPATLVDRNGRYLIHLTRPAYKTLSELAEPSFAWPASGSILETMTVRAPVTCWGSRSRKSRP